MELQSTESRNNCTRRAAREKARDHLFISYAGEDGALAEWLTLKLTAEGYKVWCDRIKLLGGESYPNDIDHAIKHRTFRVLALLSRFSIHKANPVKERTLALSIARERKIDFLIPLNVDGLSATELDWMTADLTFIPFHRSWAEGFLGLLKKLDSLDAPKNPEKGKQAVCEWFAARDCAAARNERLWTNILPIIEIPRTISQFDLEGNVDLDNLKDKWAFYRQTPNEVWAFGPPDPKIGLAGKEKCSIQWQDAKQYGQLNMHHVLTHLLKESLRSYCLRRGLLPIPNRDDLYFPPNLLTNNRLEFTNHENVRTHVLATSTRTIRSIRSGVEYREQIRYHLSPTIRPILRQFVSAAVRVGVRLHLTDTNGQPLEARRALGIRKRICKVWWNHEWLNRVMAIASWLTEGQQPCNIIIAPGGCFSIGGNLVTLTAPLGIDEEALEKAVGMEETEILDEDAGIDGAGDEESPEEPTND